MVPKINQIAKPSGKSLLKYGAVVFLIVVIGVGALVYINVRHKSVKSSQAVACPNDVLQKAGNIMAGTDYRQLDSLVPAINKTPGYERSPDCLYVLVSYDIAVGDVNKVNKDFNKLKVIYNKNRPFSALLGGKEVSYDRLQSSVDVVNKVAKQAESSSSTFANEP